MSTATFVSPQPYWTLVPPEMFDKMVDCLGHGPQCQCWADNG